MYLWLWLTALFLGCLTSVAQAASADSTTTAIETAGGHSMDTGIPEVNRIADTQYDWTGAYIGAHLGYAAGSSRWSATEAGSAGPNFTGSLDFYKGFNFSKGTGSYFGGFQGGYNYMLPSRLILGLEGDVSFPNTIKATQQISSPSIGQAGYSEMVEYFGTVRGRVGYSVGNWLIYGTGEFAWTYDQFTRTQIAGNPLGGTAVPGTSESSLHWRAGGTVGAGVEVPFAPNWTAKLEYLFTRFGTIGVKLPAAAQRFDSSLSMNEVRLGLNYGFGNSASQWNSLIADYVSINGQSNYVNQYTHLFITQYHCL